PVRLLAPLLASTLAVTLLGGSTGAPAVAAKKSETTRIQHTSFDVAADFARGARGGAVVTRDTVRMRSPQKTRRIAGQRYDLGTWTSPWVDEKFAFTELIPSWQAKTPGRSLVEVKVRLRSKVDGRTTTGSWDTVARWHQGNKRFKR